MNAADGIRQVEAKIEATEAFKAFVTPRNLVVIVLLLLVMGYCYHAGKQSGRGEHPSSNQAAHATIANSLNIVRDSQAVAGARATTAKETATTARHAHAVAAARFTIVGKEIAIDGGAPSATVPAAPVIQQIQTAKAALLADSVASIAQVALLATTQREVMIESERAELAEADAKKASPRFGIRTGLALGVTATVVVVALAAKVLSVLK